MIVTCPNCETKFEIPDDKYRPGRKARCSNCGHVFVLPEAEVPAPIVPDIPAAPVPPVAPDIPIVPDIPIAPAAPPAAPAAAFPAAAPDMTVSSDEVSSFDALMRDLDSALPGEEPPVADVGFPPHEENAGTEKKEPAAAVEEELIPPPPPASPASVDDIVVPPPPPLKGKRRIPIPKISIPAVPMNRKRLLLILGIALIVALLGYGGIMVFSALFSDSKTTDPARVTDGGVVESLGGRTSQADLEKEAARQAAVRRLALENVRQYTVSDNENTGPMVVVEGTVINNFDTPKDLILLEVTLFDKKGNALVLREQYCGITLTPLQLRTLSKAAIENALANQSSIIINNTDILPGGSVSFATVFFDLPRGAYEFEVKIIDVQDPAPR